MGASFSSNLTDAARAVHMFKINGYSATRAMARTDSLPSRRLPVGGYHWELRYTASLIADSNHWVALKLVLLAAPTSRPRSDAASSAIVPPPLPPSTATCRTRSSAPARAPRGS
ncbi:Os08g0198300 [Oryza sativa Japonica Group]|jgi:hypothetical protein|uniref:Os08g0198300 protein n=1 Tax=Oryza sativa subsp. japonica TaxID=39947 RepID=C7J5K0_ORYSJ|nr:Os08g0198300 [Oryza sativa Japonica Group]|eukprot:NP_001175425.1 Os08g0198300 [Oryza sativa Japonica Group]